MKMNWPKVADFVERVGATFAQSFLALAVVSGLSATAAMVLCAPVLDLLDA